MDEAGNNLLCVNLTMSRIIGSSFELLVNDQLEMP